ncbi:MAG: DUF2948 family protein [Litoreibacter sp.]
MTKQSNQDARFEDGAAKPLRLIAADTEDLTVISALVQDAIFPASEILWQQTQRRLALLVNRFRWEGAERSAERVQSVLTFEDATKVSSLGVERGDPDLVLSILSLEWHAGEDGTGRVELTLAGDGTIAIDAECINVALRDVTVNYPAISGKTPKHPE